MATAQNGKSGRKSRTPAGKQTDHTGQGQPIRTWTYNPERGSTGSRAEIL